MAANPYEGVPSGTPGTQIVPIPLEVAPSGTDSELIARAWEFATDLEQVGVKVDRESARVDRKAIIHDREGRIQFDCPKWGLAAVTFDCVKV